MTISFLAPIQVIFYGFAAMAVVSALVVITARNPVRSVLSLVVTFFAMAGIWMLLRAEFLSLILLLVYVGAVMTLFLFVVMMLSITQEAKTSGFIRYLPLGMLVVILLVGFMMAALSPTHFGLMKMPAPALKAADFSNLQQLGMLLFTQYVYPFEIAGVILLAAMIAAITLTYRGPVHRKVQDPAQQIAVRPEDRVRLVKLPSEPRPKTVNRLNGE